MWQGGKVWVRGPLSEQESKGQQQQMEIALQCTDPSCSVSEQTAGLLSLPAVALEGSVVWGLQGVLWIHAVPA